MKSSRRILFVSIPVILALLFSALEALPVYADESVPPTEQVGETVSEQTTEDVTTVEQGTQTDATGNPSTEEAAPTAEETGSDPTQANEPTEGSADETATESTATVEDTTTPEAELTSTAEATEEPTQEAAPQEELDTVSEIMEAIPEGTDLMVLDENGEAQSLASEDAAETLVDGDPMWCPVGVAPGGSGCTASYTSFSALIADLESGSYNVDGVIWVASSYDAANDNAQIAFDGDDLSIGSTNLIINGGWSGTLLDTTLDDTSPSTLDVSLVFANWLGNITLNNIFVGAGDGVGFGLYIDTTGDVTLNNVEVSNTSGAASGNNDGARINSGGNVVVNTSTFNGNDDTGITVTSTGISTLNAVTANDNGNGMEVHSGGTATLTDVTVWNNSLVGAYLDTYLSGSGTGLVQITGTYNLFTENGDAGLIIDSGGSTLILNTDGEDNGTNGAVIASGNGGDTDVVQIFDSSFNSNDFGTGLEIYQYGNGATTLINVIAQGNGTGASIMTYGTTGGVIIGGTASEFYSNDHSGLEVSTNGDIFLMNTSANYNVANGAYLISGGSIGVSNGFFNNNVQYNSISDPGLYAKAGAGITLDNVVASNNKFGAGAVLESTGTGDIVVTNSSVFNSNGTFGLQASNEDGNIILSTMTASYNAVKGAYLNGYGPSNVDIISSQFVENGSYGAYVCTDEGDITVSASTFNGYDTGIGGPTSYGVKLVAQNGGDITVNIGNYLNNEIAGLILVGTNNIFLNGVFTDSNGEYDVAAYSTYTEKGCYCPGDTPNSVIVNVAGGTFSNAPTGIYARVGTEGDLIFLGTQDFTGTTTPFVLDTSAMPMCTDCGCTTEEKPEGKPYNIIEVPFSGSGNVPQNCSSYAGTILQMPDGTFVKVGCPFDGFSNLQGLTEGDLPGLLGAGNNFDLAIQLGLFGEDGTYVINSDGTITLTFKIPENSNGRVHRLLFWDPTINDGAGGWYELPKFQFGTNFPLHPDNPDDPRLIVNGVSQNGNTLTVTVNFGGTFVMVAN